jgi:exosortase A-associated hydrolase 2
MTLNSSKPQPQAFFLSAEIGQRFCVYYPPAEGAARRGAIVYLHPFAEELNMTRRMAALQARELAAAGFAVLQIDLYGCGDSSGDFSQARWETWKRDVGLALGWLRERHAQPIGLWGLRLGCLLALDFSKDSEEALDPLILWQPVTHGENYLNQFLRLRLASQMMSEGAEKNASTGASREALAAGKSLEIAGYDLAPALATAIDALDIADMPPTNRTVHWFDIASDTSRPMVPANARVVGVWEQIGIDLQLHRVSCQPFWSTHETIACPELLATTVSALCKGA